MSALAWAAAGGVVGAFVMMASLYAGRALGLLDADFARYQGCIVLRRPDRGAEGLGWALHLAMGAVLALGYAAMFELLVLEPGWRSGALLGLAHGLGAGAVLPVMDSLNPCVRAGTLKEFGAFAMRRGALMVAGFIAGHVVYGALVGAAYALHGT